MHILLAILAFALVAFLFWKFVAAPAASAPRVESERSDRAFSFISNGKLFHRARGAEVREIHSPYAQESADRRERSREKHAWKQGTAFGISAGGGMRRFEAADMPLAATTAAFERDGSLLYFMRDEGIGGLFRTDGSTGNEIRVLLKPGLHLTDLAAAPDSDMLAASSQQSAGVANICLLKNDGSGLREATGGDTVDSSPAWIPGIANRLLFQSAGLARNEQGYVVALGPASIQMLNMESGSVSPIVDDPAHDHLKPRVAKDGSLLFIRRPYESPRYGMQSALLDTLLFPFRLLRAVFHYLNFFSLMYTRKPLTSANGPAREADLKDVMLQGRRIDAQKALRNARPVHGVPSLVPDSWQLVSRDTQGREKVLAQCVSSYDVAADGTIIYTNGQGVFVLEPGGSSRWALVNQLVGEVVAA